MIKKIALILLLFQIAQTYYSQCWKIVSPGSLHTVAIQNNGSLWTWGLNTYGELGDGTTIDKLTPTQIGTSTNWKYIDSRENSVAALKDDGSLWTWGDNYYGQLGLGSNGSNAYKKIPTRVGTDTDWKIIAASFGANMAAIKNDGTLWLWGLNDNGQLGNGTNVNENTPIKLGADTDWKDISIGERHLIGLKNDGSLWAWGYNYEGQLGDGTNGRSANKNIPIRIGTDTDWKAVSAGGHHTIAIKNNGSLWAWGDNFYGQLGNGNTIEQHVPIRIGNANDWQSISAGRNHSMAIKNDGTLWAWGYNSDGQLGDGTTLIQRNTPVKIGTDTNWQSVNAGVFHTTALKKNNTSWIWGENGYGELGDGTTIQTNIPNMMSCSTLAVSETSQSIIQLYPNPAKEYFCINSKEIKQVQLYSINGKLIKEYFASNKYFIYNLSKGIYIVKVIDNKGLTSNYKLEISN